MIGTAEVGDLKPNRLSSEIFLCAEYDIQPNATHRGARQTRDNPMESRPTALQILLGEPQLDQGVSVQDVDCASSILLGRICTRTLVLRTEHLPQADNYRDSARSLGDQFCPRICHIRTSACTEESVACLIYLPEPGLSFSLCWWPRLETGFCF